MKTWIYSWLIYPMLYSLARVVGLWNAKVRDTMRLRSWKDFLSLRFNAGQPIEYWIHVASHGELEYAIPILQELGRRQKRLIVTYYSVSAKNPVEQLPATFPNVSLVVPLPHDGLGLMKEFVALVRRQGVRHLLLMKYELWPGLLWECNAQGIKVLLVDALKPGWFHRRLLHKLDGILSGYDSEVSAIVHKRVEVVGDTRVERVLQRIEQSQGKLDALITPSLRQVLKSQPTLVCGSMWPPDTRLVVAALKLLQQKNLRCHIVWVPHELDQAEANRAAASFESIGFKTMLLEQLEPSLLSGESLAIIVMKKGILAELYRLGLAAFVGGGFGDGVHSVWEPALCGAFVACGPRTERSPESRELASRGVLKQATEPEDLAKWLEESLFLRPQNVVPIEKKYGSNPVLKELLEYHVGAAHRVIDVCEGK